MGVPTMFAQRLEIIWEESFEQQYRVYFIEFFRIFIENETIEGEFSWKVLSMSLTIIYESFMFQFVALNNFRVILFYFTSFPFGFTHKTVVIAESQIKLKTLHKRFMLAVDFYCFSFTSLFDSVLKNCWW